MYSDRDIIIIIITGIIILALFITFIIVFLFTFQRSYLRHLVEMQQLQAGFQQELLRTQLEIQEQTFKKISQEVHDNIGQVLSLAKLNINTMNPKEPNQLEEKITDSKHLISKAIQDLRDLSRSLNADYVKEMGLLKSIEYELEMIKRTGNFQTSLTADGNIYRLEQQEELILFRIFQEVLNNIIKHAKASLVTVHVNFCPDNFVLQIQDNGQGFNPVSSNENNNGQSGLGIRNMTNRAKIIGAEFNLQSAIDKGTTVKINIPVKQS